MSGPITASSAAFSTALAGALTGLSLDAAGDAPLWSGWRRRTLVLAVLCACAALLALTLGVAATPAVGGRWVATDLGGLRLLSSPVPALAALQGQQLVAVAGHPVDAAVLHRSPRWQPQDQARQAAIAQQEAISRSLASGSVTLRFKSAAAATPAAAAAAAEGPAVAAVAAAAAPPGAVLTHSIDLLPHPRGLAGLGWAYAPLAALALALVCFGCTVWLARPVTRSLLFLIMTLCQGGNLLNMAVATVPGLGTGLPTALWFLMAWDMPVRLALDLATAAAVVHVFAIHPRRLPHDFQEHFTPRPEHD